MTPTTEYDFFNFFVPDDQAATKYINILHHNFDPLKSGYVYQVIFDGNRIINHRAYNDLTEVITANTDSLAAPGVYCTMNRFRNGKRDTSHLFAVTGMVIDLDEHDKTGASLEDVKNSTISKLDNLFKSGALLEPTMIVDSGRGLHIYYILDRPIANVKKNAAFIKYYKYIYDKVINAYHDELSCGKYLNVDKKATLFTQLIRIPGFKNSKAGKMARLYDNEVKYYSVDEIKTGCKLDERFNIHPDSHVTTVVKSAKSFLVTERKYLDTETNDLFIEINADRLKIFDKIQKLFTSRGEETGYREQLAFFYYNSACIVDRSQAIDRLVSFNSSYIIPLDDKALTSIIKTVDKVQNNYGEEGWYPISNWRIKKKLKLSDEDARAVGLGLYLRRIQREQAKKETQDKRDRRREIIKTSEQ